MDPVQTAPTTSQPSNIPICQNCTTATTPLWRRSDAGQILCNACGLFLKLHNRARPISLKTNVIKSRNRVRPTNKLSSTATTTTTTTTTEGQGEGQAEKRVSYPASHPSTGGNNIAPQHLFDNAVGTLSPSDLTVTSDTVGGGGDGEVVFVGESSGEVLANLRTRVSELEVINELFRGRVGELEVSEREAREEVERLSGEVEELKARLGGDGGEGGRKRARVDDGEGVEARETSSNFMMP